METFAVQQDSSVANASRSRPEVPDASKRCKAAEALRHPWLGGAASPLTVVGPAASAPDECNLGATVHSVDFSVWLQAVSTVVHQQVGRSLPGPVSRAATRPRACRDHAPSP